MKSTLSLRRVDEVECARRHAVARWQRDGHSAQLRLPQPQSLYITFWAQGSQGLWRGMVGANEWLHAVWPQMPPLFFQGCTPQDILELFAAVDKPVEVPPALLDYQRLFDIELAGGQSLQKTALVPCIETDQSHLWILELPPAKQAPRPLQAWLLALPQTLRVVLGNGVLDSMAGSALMCGDVLLIVQRTQQIIVADQYVGQFTFIKEGLHMELNPSENVAPVEPDLLSQMPVKLEFVLGESVLTMAQLNELIEQQVLPLEASALNQVEVRTGGRCIAVGELVQLEGRLGVELREIFRGDGNE